MLEPRKSDISFQEDSKFREDVMELAKRFDQSALYRISGLVCLTGMEIWSFSRALAKDRNIDFHRRFSDPQHSDLQLSQAAFLALQAQNLELQKENKSLKLQLGLTTVSFLQGVQNTTT